MDKVSPIRFGARVDRFPRKLELSNFDHTCELYWTDTKISHRDNCESHGSLRIFRCHPNGVVEETAMTETTELFLLKHGQYAETGLLV